MEEVVMDEEIRNAMELEIRRLNEEEEVEKKKVMEEKEIRDIRFKFVIHVSPLEIIDHYHTAAADHHVLAAAEKKIIELVIDVIHHDCIYQYWSPPLKRRRRFMGDDDSSTSSLLCQHHDYLHPRDDDDEDMILTSCRSFCEPLRRIQIVTLLDQGVFATADDDEHIISTQLLGDVDVMFSQYRILNTQESLQDVKTSIARRICEAKAAAAAANNVLSMAKRIRTCVDVCWAAKKYYASAEAATFASAMDTATAASISMDQFRRQVLPWRMLYGHRV